MAVDPTMAYACNTCDALLDNLITIAQEHLKCTKEHTLKKLLLGRTSPQRTGVATSVMSVEQCLKKLEGPPL